MPLLSYLKAKNLKTTVFNKEMFKKNSLLKVTKYIFFSYKNIRRIRMTILQYNI